MVSQSTPLEPAMVRSSGPHIHLPQPPTGALTVGVSLCEYRDASPPHAAPDGAPEVDAIAVGFEELWNAYGRRTKRQEAKAAFVALAPDRELVAVMLAAAQRWYEHYEAAATAPQYRKQLHTWLKAECFLEDPPTRGEAPPRKSAPMPTPVQPAFTAGPCEIVATSHTEGDHSEEVGVKLQPATGVAFWRIFRIDMGDKDAFRGLIRAAGLTGVSDTDELHGRRLWVDGEAFAPLPANDNGRAAA